MNQTFKEYIILIVNKWVPRMKKEGRLGILDTKIKREASRLDFLKYK